MFIFEGTVRNKGETQGMTAFMLVEVNTDIILLLEGYFLYFMPVSRKV